MKKLFVFLLLILTFNLILCQTPSMILRPFEIKARDVRNDDAEELSDMFRQSLSSQSQWIRIVDTNSLARAMSQIRWEDSFWQDYEETTELGKVTNAHYILEKSISQLGNSISFTFILRDIKNLNPITTVRRNYSDNILWDFNNGIPSDIEQIVAEILKETSAVRADRDRRDEEQRLREEPARAALNSAREQIRTGVYASAITNFTNALNQFRAIRSSVFSYDEDIFHCLFGLFVSHYNTQSFQSAVTYGEQALSLDPSNKELVVHLALGYSVGLNDFDGAIETWRRFEQYDSHTARSEIEKLNTQKREAERDRLAREQAERDRLAREQADRDRQAAIRAQQEAIKGDWSSGGNEFSFMNDGRFFVSFETHGSREVWSGSVYVVMSSRTTNSYTGNYTLQGSTLRITYEFYQTERVGDSPLSGRLGGGRQHIRSGTTVHSVEYSNNNWTMRITSCNNSNCNAHPWCGKTFNKSR
jgi:tetratricopeptide (TPR) repeat protein